MHMQRSAGRSRVNVDLSAPIRRVSVSACRTRREVRRGANAETIFLGLAFENIHTPTRSDVFILGLSFQSPELKYDGRKN